MNLIKNKTKPRDFFIYYTHFLHKHARTYLPTVSIYYVSLFASLSRNCTVSSEVRSDVCVVSDKPEGNIPILPRGVHQFPFRFQLPESSLPCSFESKPGFIRYYIKVRQSLWHYLIKHVIVYFVVVLQPVASVRNSRQIGFCRTLRRNNFLLE